MDDPTTYPLITSTDDDRKRVALIEALFELGEWGGTIQLVTGRAFVVERGAFWCMGPGYRGGVVVPAASATVEAD